MSKQQEYVLWIGLLLLLVYLFTDANVRNAIFGKGSAASTTTNTFLASVTAGLPSSTGNTQNNGNAPKVVLA